MPMPVLSERETGHKGCGGMLVSVEGKALPLLGAVVSGEAEGGLASVVLRQSFANTGGEALEVTYAFPLPADGAVAGYEFRIGERRVVGEIDRRREARERYEKALTEGRTAGLLEQERADLFTQSLGNVPPGQEVLVELRIDQKLRWLPEGMWEWRFPTVAAPRYLGAEGRVADAGRLTVDVADGATGVRASLDFLIRDPLPEGREPESSSHRIRNRRSENLDAAAGSGGAAGKGGSAATAGARRVLLADEPGVALDRDLVVRWPVVRPASGVTLRRTRPAAGLPHAGHAYGLLTIVPPEERTEAGERRQTLPRDLIILIDTSGSMSGGPLDLAKRVAGGLVGSLGAADRLEMIAFSSTPQPWRRGAAEVTEKARRQALDWIKSLRAGGGTEMTQAVLEGLQPLRSGAQRQVVLVTDGQIGFEEEVFRAIRDNLPAGSRFHAVGVGTAVNRALLAPAARAGRGVEVIIDLDEAPDRGVARLMAATRGPALTDLEIAGSALTGQAPRRPPDVLAGAPVLASVRLRAEGGELTVRGRSAAGPWTRTLAVPATDADSGSPAVTALYGREAVEDLELDRAAGANAAEIDRLVERLGLEFGIGTRLTSWVAISEEPTVDPGQPVRRTRIPQELPYGLSAEGLGLRQAQGLMMAQTFSSIPEAAALRGMHLPTVGLADIGARALRSILRSRGVSSKDVPPGEDLPASEPPALDEALPHHDEALPLSAGPFTGRWAASAAPDVQVLGPGVQVLEFEVTGGVLLWYAESPARLLLPGGGEVTVAVDVDASTRAGRIEAGTVVRLALRMAPDLRDRAVAVELRAGPRIVRIQL